MSTRATDRTGVFISCEITLFQTFIKSIIHFFKVKTFLNEEIKSTEGTTLILANSTPRKRV